ncbi:DDE_3 domain-containing protein [Trichonephila clavipes]|nr:DDE_3 domain-containing protein [Trichonephila clavipes]
MDDNATSHRTLAVHDCLDSESIQRLVWPARSPDLNPIENVWDALGRQVAGRNYPLTNKNTLIRALTKEWDKLPQQLLDNVVQSMASQYIFTRTTYYAILDLATFLFMHQLKAVEKHNEMHLRFLFYFTSWNSTQAHLLPSTSTFAVTTSSESQPHIPLIDTAPTTSNSLCTSAASSLSNKAFFSSTGSMFSPLPAETSPCC